MTTLPPRTYLRMHQRHTVALPEEFRHDDVRFSEELVTHFVEQYTTPRAVIFDPFAGYGTTLVVAERMGRTPCGIEIDEPRARYIQSRLQSPDALLWGDARRLADYALPPFDLSLTSPPYMQRGDPEDPFAAYSESGRGYDSYLETIQDIYRQMRPLIKATSLVVIEVANLKNANGMTPLAWDVARAVSEVLTFVGEIVIMWEEGYGYGYDHSYCLLFRRDAS